MEFNNQQREKKDYGTRINQWIREPEVLVIDEKGENLGAMSTEKAITLAKEAGLALFFLNFFFSKYLYEQKKKLRKNKASKAKDLKEFRFSPVIDTGDFNTRVRRAIEFLEKGHPVKITATKKGRQPYDKMKAVFDQILTNFTEYSSIEPEPKSEGNRISITFKKNGTTKNKQNSSQENKAIQPEGEQEGQNDVQTESSGSSQDEKIN